jgi:hypothetical protein
MSRGIAGCLVAVLVLLAAACEQRPVENAYFPLDAGRSWIYAVRSDDGAGVQTLGVTSLGEETVGGLRVTKEQVELGGEAHFIYLGVDERGVFRHATQSPGEDAPGLDEARDYFLGYPLATGKSWKGKGAPSFLDVAEVAVDIRSTVESTGETVEVPAGKFTGCVKVVVNGSAALADGGGVFSVKEQTWYARDVGMVKSLVEESVAGGPQEGRIRVTIELQASAR